MNEAIRAAKAILAKVRFDDATTTARGRRAHARVVATIEAAEQLAGIETQLRIANLVALSGLGGDAALKARAEAEELIWPAQVDHKAA
ncbi:hypothetical protein [Arthrobacter sp. A2-55]|uniref:hypothetical protein n=1 Tax=Arthrobacter sp. A2-55 TaxID=2897337 RepID=UPI0021CD6DAD|nr:hypothetical protein [Arthrobacter sp. A2-55]MCU6480483.1 hypothetical protein [Arthrobacter sp. A2-55]